MTHELPENPKSSAELDVIAELNAELAERYLEITMLKLQIETANHILKLCRGPVV